MSINSATTSSLVMSVVARATAMALAVVMALLVERPMAVARV
jgi:hypothetical protein